MYRPFVNLCTVILRREVWLRTWATGPPTLQSLLIWPRRFPSPTVGPCRGARWPSKITEFRRHRSRHHWTPAEVRGRTRTFTEFLIFLIGSHANLRARRSDDTEARKDAGHAHALGGSDPGGTSRSHRQQAAANPPSRWLLLAGSGRLRASGRRALTRVTLVSCARRSRPTTCTASTRSRRT